MKTFLFIGDDFACEVSKEDIETSWAGIVPKLKLGEFIYPNFQENFEPYILISAENYTQAREIWDCANMQND